MTPPAEATYLGDEFTREMLTHLLGDVSVLPVPQDEAACEYLRGQTLIIVPRHDQDRTARSAAYFLRSLQIPCSVSPVSTRWIVTDNRLPFTPEKLKALMAGEAQQDKALALTMPETDVSWLNGYERQEIPMLLDAMLPRGVVGGINAEGGTGKTFLIISLFAALATGIPWGPFRPVRPFRVLLLLAEDPEHVVKNRVFDVCRQIPQSHHELLARNLHVKSVRGTSGPLMGMADGNPSATVWSEWLVGTIHGHPGLDVLGIDPLRKFYGLDENKNEFAHAFIGLLEKFSQDHDLSILYNHHVAKSARGAEIGQITGRGAGGLSDNCRWMAAMRGMDADLHSDLALDGSAQDYVEFAVTKNNYAPRLPSPAYFRRGEGGVLEPTNIVGDLRAEQADLLTAMIDNSALPISRRDITSSSKRGRDIRDAMKDRFPNLSRDDLSRVVGHAIKNGSLEETNQEYGRGGNRTILRRTNVPF